MSWKTTWNTSNTNALIALAVVSGIRVSPSSPELRDELKQTSISSPENANIFDRAIRDLLRIGGFKPAGRNRPAQEYLARMVETVGGLQNISNAVDVNNLISLRYRLPASVIKASVLPGGLIIREGRPGETYKFNASGQELNLEGLLCLCSRDDEPVASPIKDAFSSHVDDATTEIVTCVYSSRELTSPDSLRSILDEYIALLLKHCGGRHSVCMVIKPDEAIKNTW